MLSLATGCIATAPTSHLANGEQVTTGAEQFDTFFASVGEVKKKADAAEGEAELRKKVASALGLEDRAKTNETLDAAKSKANDLKKDGSKLYVVLDPEAKLVLRAGAEEKAEAKQFVEAVGGAITEGLKRADELTAFAREVEALEATVPSLESALETTFPEEAKRADVKLELDAAKDLLEKARLKGESESGRALRFSVMLAGAVDSGAAAELLAMQASKGAEKPKKGGKGGAKAGGGGKVVKAKPKQDFDP
jgi:hypothetical protein